MFIRSTIMTAGSVHIDKPDFIYNTVYEIEGPASQDVMKDKLDKTTKGLTISEN